MTVLLALCLAASAAATWGVIRLGRRLWALVRGAWANKCPHYSWFGVCASCAHDRRDAEARQRIQAERWDREKSSLPGAAAGGSSYVHDDDDWFDQLH